MMRRRNIFAVLGIFALAVLTAHAEDFWVKKDWTKWSKDECTKVLQNSPWSKEWSKGEVRMSAALPASPANGGKGGSGGTIGASAGPPGPGQEGALADSTVEVHYFMELGSALPVREAIVRRAQINNNYDKMDAEHKKAFDGQVQAVLTATYEDVIDVRVSYGSSQQYLERQLDTYWKAIPEDALPVEVYLINEKGDHIAPVKFISPKNADYSFEMYFPRTQNNQPVIHEGDKSFSVQFPHPSAIGSQRAGQNSPSELSPGGSPISSTAGKERVLATYQLNKMMVGGKPAY